MRTGKKHSDGKGGWDRVAVRFLPSGRLPTRRPPAQAILRRVLR